MNKSVKEKLLKKVAKAISVTAVKACGATSYFDCFQPKEPHKTAFEALKQDGKWIEQGGCNEE